MKEKEERTIISQREVYSKPLASVCEMELENNVLQTMSSQSSPTTLEDIEGADW
jgi:hypothetical protein